LIACHADTLLFADDFAADIDAAALPPPLIIVDAADYAFA